MDDQRDYGEEDYLRNFCDACGVSPCQWDGEPDGFHTDKPLTAARDTDAKLLAAKPRHELCAIIASEDPHPLSHSSDYGHWDEGALVEGILAARFGPVSA